MVLYYTGYNSTSGCFSWGWYPAGTVLEYDYNSNPCVVFVAGGINNGASLITGPRNARTYEVMDVSDISNCGVVTSGGLWWNTPLGTLGPTAPGGWSALITLDQ